MNALLNAIFISYRRVDLTQDQVNVIHEGLEGVFGNNSVFLDTSDIHGGAKWKEVLNQAGSNARICLILIGKNWLEKDKNGSPRILAEGDWVRKEIEYAIEKKLTIIPTLVNGGQLPAKEDLPLSLHSIHDSQTMKLEMDQWATYREKFYKDIRFILGLDKVIEINKPIRFDRKRILLFFMLPIIAVLGFLFLKKKTIDIDSPEPIDSTAVTVTASTQLCPPFTQPQKLNALIFPIESDHVKNLERDIDDEFTINCEKYGLQNENKIAGCYRGQNVSSTDLPTIAKQLGADLYFSGILTTLDAHHRFKARFGLSNDSLNVWNASPKNFSLALTNVSLQDLTGGEAMDTLFARVIQYILGLVAYQKKEYQTALQIFKDLGPQSIQNDTMQKVIYSIMVDACDQSGKPDSAMLYLQKLNILFPSDHNITLKTGLLAEKYKKPDIAILSFSQLIDHSKYDKNVLHEKRADQYTEIKDYSNAKNDYQKVQPRDPVQTKRVQSKEKEVDDRIKVNKRAMDNINQIEATDIQKVTMADQLLQIGQTAKANELLNTISESSPVAKQAEPLKQEAQLKTNPAINIIIQESTLKANPRLKTEVLKRNSAVIKQH